MLHTPRTICLRANSVNQNLTRHLIPTQILEHQVRPFVSLEVVRAGEVSTEGEFFMTSDSRTAIITVVLSGEASFEDSTDNHGMLKKNGVLWMLSGSGIKYSIKPKSLDCIIVKLRVALSPALEEAPARSIYLDSTLVECDGPAQILLGQHGDAFSRLALPALINYLVVTLKAGQAWIYEPPVNHRLAWVAALSGKIKTSDMFIESNEIALYESSNKSISFLAEEDCIFLLGTSQEYTHDLSFESYPISNLSELNDKGRLELSARPMCA